jgi:SurA N-terminal domain.
MIIKAVFPLFILLQPGAILVDRIVAQVNEEIITLHDVERAVALLPVQRLESESEDEFHSRILDDLVTSKVIALEYGDEFTLNEEDVEAVQRKILQKAGSLEALQAILGGFAMNWDDFKRFIREKVLYEKVLREKFPMELIIPFDEIEAYYNSVYLPSHLQIGLEPQSLVEMAPQIETFLRRRRMEQQLSEWLADIRSAYRIEIKPRSPR